jgi:hypothetical protein
MRLRTVRSTVSQTRRFATDGGAEAIRPTNPSACPCEGRGRVRPCRTLSFFFLLTVSGLGGFAAGRFPRASLSPR